MRDERDQQMARMTRRSLLSGGAAALAGGIAWEWLRTRSLSDSVPWPLRAGLDANDRLAQGYFREAALARTFPLSSVQSLPVNGEVGIEDDPEANWRLSFDGRSLSLGDIQALPRISMITELKCIEGWSRVVEWSGARLIDFLARFDQGAHRWAKYVSLETPDGDYYVGLDTASAPASPDFAVLRDERPTPDIRARRSLAPSYPREVRDQESQAHRKDRFQR